jgi:hypothetical protein
MEAVPKALRLTIHQYIDFRLQVPIPLTSRLVISLGETLRLDLSYGIARRRPLDHSPDIVRTDQLFRVIVQSSPHLLL